VFNRALDTLLMHHVSLGVIWIVTKRPSELLGKCMGSAAPSD
jgi:hypothetical protein